MCTEIFTTLENGATTTPPSQRATPPPLFFFFKNADGPCTSGVVARKRVLGELFGLKTKGGEKDTMERREGASCSPSKSSRYSSVAN